PTTPEISTLSLHAALPISRQRPLQNDPGPGPEDSCPVFSDSSRSPFPSDQPSGRMQDVLPVGSFRRASNRLRSLLLSGQRAIGTDRKSTRLNSSHVAISYA